jgi:hypothetical protein
MGKSDTLDEQKTEETHEKHTHTKRNVFLAFICISSAVVILLSFVQNKLQKEQQKSLKREHFYKHEATPSDTLSKSFFIEENYFSADELKELDKMIQEGTFSTIIREKSPLVASAGEAVSLDHPHCHHPFMNVDLQRKSCHFSQRIDVGRHFLATGGFSSHMESYEKMLARILTFNMRVDAETFDNFNHKAKNDAFLNKVASLCARDGQSVHDKPVVDFYQTHLIVLLPGQEVPMHLDAPYFFGADKTSLPEWLLVVMKQSELFNDIVVKDVKGVLLLNSPKKDADDENVGGEFYLFLNRSQNYYIFANDANKAVIFDGTELIHGVDRYKWQHSPNLVNKSHRYSLKHSAEAGKWDLIDEAKQVIETFDQSDLKFAVTWRAHCFSNEEEKTRFYNQSKSDYLSIQAIADRFKEDLKTKNRLPAADISFIDLWTIVLKDYLEYPHNKNLKHFYESYFTFNYCLLPNVVPTWVTENLLDPILQHIC